MRNATGPGRQHGLVLVIALIVLVAMTLAGIGLVRSVDSNVMIAGNFANKQTTLQAVDAGVEAAYDAVFARLTANSTGEARANAYYPVLQTLGASGAPSEVSWSAAPYVDMNSVAGSKVQYVIERMCAPTPGGTVPLTDSEILASCITEPSDLPPCVRAPCAPWTSTQKVNYRVTVRVIGPRKTISLAQSVLTF